MLRGAAGWSLGHHIGQHPHLLQPIPGTGASCYQHRNEGAGEAAAGVLAHAPLHLTRLHDLAEDSMPLCSHAQLGLPGRLYLSHGIRSGVRAKLLSKLNGL